MKWRLQGEPTVMERVLAGLSYGTFGIAGLLYMLFSKSGSQSQVFRFHFFQSILLWIIFTLVSWGAGPLLDITAHLLAAIAPQALAPTIGTVLFCASVLTKAFYLLLLYGAVLAFLGKFAEVPFISNLVRQNMRY
jgi:uncharacterized membrane protein